MSGGGAAGCEAVPCLGCQLGIQHPQRHSNGMQMHETGTGEQCTFSPRPHPRHGQRKLAALVRVVLAARAAAAAAAAARRLLLRRHLQLVGRRGAAKLLLALLDRLLGRPLRCCCRGAVRCRRLPPPSPGGAAAWCLRHEGHTERVVSSICGRLQAALGRAEASGARRRPPHRSLQPRSHASAAWQRAVACRTCLLLAPGALQGAARRGARAEPSIAGVCVWSVWPRVWAVGCTNGGRKGSRMHMWGAQWEALLSCGVSSSTLVELIDWAATCVICSIPISDTVGGGRQGEAACEGPPCCEPREA